MIYTVIEFSPIHFFMGHFGGDGGGYTKDGFSCGPKCATHSYFASPTGKNEMMKRPTNNNNKHHHHRHHHVHAMHTG